MSSTQRASQELAQAVFADPDLREKFERMARDTEKREPAPDDFAWLPTKAVLNLRRGDRVRFRDVHDDWHEGRALGRARMGHKFWVIPVCKEDEWWRDRPPDELAWRAWPIEDVSALRRRDPIAALMRRKWYEGI